MFFSHLADLEEVHVDERLVEGQGLPGDAPTPWYLSAHRGGEDRIPRNNGSSVKGNTSKLGDGED